jgi:FtsZ-interacting cell division protein ZipA
MEIIIDTWAIIGLGIGAIIGMLLYQLWFNRMHKRRMKKLNDIMNGKL